MKKAIIVGGSLLIAAALTCAVIIHCILPPFPSSFSVLHRMMLHLASAGLILLGPALLLIVPVADQAGYILPAAALAGPLLLAGYARRIECRLSWVLFFASFALLWLACGSVLLFLAFSAGL